MPSFYVMLHDSFEIRMLACLSHPLFLCERVFFLPYSDLFYLLLVVLCNLSGFAVDPSFGIGRTFFVAPIYNLQEVV